MRLRGQHRPYGSYFSGIEALGYLGLFALLSGIGAAAAVCVVLTVPEASPAPELVVNASEPLLFLRIERPCGRG